MTTTRDRSVLATVLRALVVVLAVFAVAPTASQAAWSSQTSSLAAVIIGTTECPTSTTCIQEQNNGKFQYTTNGGSTWTASTVDLTDGFYSISCPTTTVCYADNAPGAVWKKQSTSDTWTQVATDPVQSDILSPYTHSLSCPSLNVCYEGATDGTISKTSNGGTTWTNLTTATTPDIYALQCVSDTRCIAVGVANKSEFTDDGGATWTTENTGSAAAMYSVTWMDGSTALAGDAIGVPYRYGAPQPPGATLTASEAIGAGTLSFLAGSPGNVTFPTTTLTNADQTVTATQPITVVDATGSGTGWSVSTTSTTFTAGAKVLANNSTSVTSAPTLACAASTTCTLATNSVSFPFFMPANTPAPTASKLYTAAAGTGLGAQVITPTWSLKVPATALTGTYTSTWTFTLAAGP